MSKYTAGTLYKDATRKLRGGAASKSYDYYGAIDEGRRNFLKKVNPVELQRLVNIEQAVYDQVDRYAVPDDLNYDNLIQIKQLASRKNLDTLEHPLTLVYNRRFDQKRRNARNVVSIINQNGMKYMKLFHPKGLRHNTQTEIHDANSLTENGTWNVGGNLVDLIEDKLTYIAGTGSLRFDMNTSSTTGTLENTTLNAVDITEYLQIGAVFTWLEVNLPRELLAVKITLESSPGNNYEFSVNQAHDNSSFVKGWNLLKFPLDGLTINGTPNPREITGVRFTFTTAGTQPMLKCHIDNIVARKGVVYEMIYQTSYCFIDPITRAWKQFVDSQDDIIPLEEDAYQLLMLEVALALQKELFTSSVGKKSDVNDIDQELKEGYRMYRMSHKSEVMLRQDSYYIFGTYLEGYSDDPLSGYEGDGGDNVQSEQDFAENPNY